MTDCTGHRPPAADGDVTGAGRACAATNACARNAVCRYADRTGEALP
ncbi:hypothetical protein [Actinoplanes xinjiangensis]